MSHAFAWLTRHGWLVFAMFVAGFLGALFWMLPPRTLVIETGPVGGTYYQEAVKYQGAMKKLGFRMVLRPRDDSMRLIGDVSDRASGVDIGFIAQAVDPAKFPGVTTLGSIGYQPLFLFQRAGLPPVTRPVQLRGLRVGLAAQGSATSAAAMSLLGAFGVTPGNAQLTHATLADQARLLKEGAIDAAFFMLEADNPLVTDLATDDRVRLASLDATEAIARHFPFLRAATIPRGTYDLARDLPPADVRVLAATAEVVVRKTMHPAIVYSLLQVISTIHEHAGIIAREGEFPSMKNSQLPVNRYAEDYYKNGMPWANRNFNIVLATLFDTFLVLLLPLFLVMPLYQALGLPSGSDLFAAIRTRAWLVNLQAFEARVAAGQPLSRRQYALLRIIEQDVGSHTDQAEACAEALRRLRAWLEHRPPASATAPPLGGAQPAE
jgi:TRAP-type uncharacterized transport system substrate-binding protein